ncbi:bifunctional allantoicase/(S)-ureidoglycine aminohydrolase [Roseovarius aestuarii]|nr:bifunctional allantoicase/(S)-ureidoglycine aminohydrolase [Roseovarius aestuarii]
MSSQSYYTPPGGLPPQTQLLTDRAVFTDAYALIPKGSFSDIVASSLPFWRSARFWVMSRPMSGFAESFSQYIAEVEPGGGSVLPETEANVEAVLFFVKGTGTVTIDGVDHRMRAGGYTYIPPTSRWSFHNDTDDVAVFHWIRKAYCRVDGLEVPDVIVSHDDDMAPIPMPDTDGAWATTRFVDPRDLRHDMHVTIVTLQPGAVIPFAETHVMEHGLYVLQGKAVYRLNQDWVEVEAGDYMWLRAFCPQACYAGGPVPFRYLLYKDVNRHMPLGTAALGGDLS